MLAECFTNDKDLDATEERREECTMEICDKDTEAGHQCTVGHDLDKTPLKPKSTNAFGYCRTSFGRCRMTWNLSLAPFRALKMPKKGLKTTKKCLFGYSEASYVTQIHFFLQYASSYVS